MLSFTKSTIADVVASISTQSLAETLSNTIIKRKPILGIPEIHMPQPVIAKKERQLEILASAALATGFHETKLSHNLVVNSLIETLIDDLVSIAIRLFETGEFVFHYAEFAQRFTKSVIASYTSKKLSSSSTLTDSFVAGVAGDVCSQLVEEVIDKATVSRINIKKAVLSGALKSFYGGVYSTIVK